MKEDVELLHLGESYLKIRNYDKAYEYLSRAVMGGKSRAATPLYQLGLHFLSEKEYKKAERCFQILADRGHSESCLELGKMCEEGLGRHKDMEAAFGYYGQGFQCGNALCAYRAGLLMMSDAMQFEEVRDIAMTWYQEAIKGGIWKAYTQMGNLYNADIGFAEHTPRNNRIALSWYLRGAMHGEGSSLKAAADLFYYGRGIPQDVKRAILMYQQAADAGESSACLSLGLMYESGKGVHKNQQESLRWFRRGREMGDEHCRHEEGQLYYLMGMKLAAKEPYPCAQVITYLKQAGDLGCPGAYAELADMARMAGDQEGYVVYLKEGIQKNDHTCQELWLAYRKEPLQKEMDVLMKLFEERERSAFYRSKKKMNGYIQTFLKLEPLLRELGEEMDDMQCWQVLALLYLRGGADFGRTEKDFLQATRHVIDIKETKEVQYLLWLYYSGESQRIWKGSISHENPRKAAALARKLASSGARGFNEVMAEYYARGYGLKKNQKTALEWIQKDNN